MLIVKRKLIVKLKILNLIKSINSDENDQMPLWYLANWIKERKNSKLNAV